MPSPLVHSPDAHPHACTCLADDDVSGSACSLSRSFRCSNSAFQAKSYTLLYPPPLTRPPFLSPSVLHFARDLCDFDVRRKEETQAGEQEAVQVVHMRVLARNSISASKLASTHESRRAREGELNCCCCLRFTRIHLVYGCRSRKTGFFVQLDSSSLKAKRGGSPSCQRDDV